MAVKIKSNDDRILAAAVAVLLISRAQLSRGESRGLIRTALEAYRSDYADYKAGHPRRDMVAAKELGSLTHAGRRAVYEKLLAAMIVLLARIERNRTQFSSLTELDNFLAFNLRQFDEDTGA